MSKAILVLDMPRNCTRCWLVQMEIHDAEASPYCGVAEGPFGGWRTIDVKTGGRPDWCPLREMPERRETISIVNAMREAKLNHVTTANQFGYNVGWNDFIKVLNGDFLARERERYSDWEKEHDWSEWEDEHGHEWEDEDDE